MYFWELYLPAYLPGIYHSIRCLICHAVLISLLPQHHYPAVATLLSCCGNIVVLLRQHCCPAAATLLFCCGNMWKAWSNIRELNCLLDGNKKSWFPNEIRIFILWRSAKAIWNNILVQKSVPFFKTVSERRGARDISGVSKVHQQRWVRVYRCDSVSPQIGRASCRERV